MPDLISITPAAAQASPAAELQAKSWSQSTVDVYESDLEADTTCQHDSDHGPAVVFVKAAELCADCARTHVDSLTNSQTPHVDVELFLAPTVTCERAA